MSNKENDIFMANRLKEIRIHKGLNQKDFAKKNWNESLRI